MYKLYVCVAILQITVQWKSNLFFVAAGTVGNMIIEWHNMVSLAVLSLAFQFAFFYIYMNTIYRSDLTNRVMISYLHNSAFSRKVSQSFVTNIFFIFVRNLLHVLHVCFCFGLKSDCHIPLVFEACFLHLLRKCPVYVPGRYPTLTVTSVVALTASCQWMVDGVWTWSGERVREWEDGEGETAYQSERDSDVGEHRPVSRGALHAFLTNTNGTTPPEYLLTKENHERILM